MPARSGVSPLPPDSHCRRQEEEEGERERESGRAGERERVEKGRKREGEGGRRGGGLPSVVTLTHAHFWGGGCNACAK